MEDLTIQELSFNDEKRTVEADWEDYGINYTLSGSWQPRRKTQDSDISFTLVSGNSSPIHFKGTIDPLRSIIKGMCTGAGSQEFSYGFSFDLAEAVPGLLKLTIGNERPVEKIVVMDYQNKRMTSAPGQEPEIELAATEAIDQAEITYAIMTKDVTYLNIDGKAHIQAKFTARADEDTNGNGMGVAETDAILYNIDSIAKKSDKGLDQKDKKAVGEPKERTTVNFYIN